MIRFSAFLVAVAVGLLVAGVVTSKLLLVYVAIGVSGAALLALGIGAAVNWRELTGKSQATATEASAQGPAPAPQVAAAPQVQVPAPAASEAAFQGAGWPATVPAAPSRAGFLPTDQSLAPQPAAAQPFVAQPFGAQPAAAQPAAAQPAAAQPAAGQRPPGDLQRPPAAFTPRPSAPARDLWEWHDRDPLAPPAARSNPNAVRRRRLPPPPRQPSPRRRPPRRRRP